MASDQVFRGLSVIAFQEGLFDLECECGLRLKMPFNYESLMWLKELSFIRICSRCKKLSVYKLTDMRERH
jgi:hypothetical protein